MLIDIVSYAMGAAGKAKIISVADWEAMTDEEKANYGMVALNTADSGYFRGYLVDGKSLSRSLLDMSDAPFISLEEFWDTFMDGDEAWGNFITHGTGLARNESEACLSITNGTWLTADVLGEGTFTVYIVCQDPATQSTAKAMMCVKRNDTQNSYFASNGTNTHFYHTNNSYSNISGTNPSFWHVLSLAFDISSGNISAYTDGVYKVTSTVVGVLPEMLSLAAKADGALVQALDVKYCAVVQKTEVQGEIIANQQKIMQYFGLGEV